MRKMKDSGIAWIGEMPDTWGSGRLKDIAANEIYSIVDGPFGTAISTSDYKRDGVPLVRIVNLNQTELKTDNFVYITEEHAKKVSRSRFYKGDIIFAKTGATVGKCAYNANVENGILSSSCVKIRIAEDYCRKYFFYFFNTAQFNEALRMACNGTTRDTINLKPFSCLPCLIPPLKDQQGIAAYLDEQCSIINEIIEKTKASIEEYKKLKQAIITEAVTKGVSGDVLEEESTLKWMREIPSHWMRTKLGNICSFINGDRSQNYPSPDEFVSSGIPFIGADSLEGHYVDTSVCKYITKEKYETMNGLKIHKGDILYTLRGSTIGKNSYADFSEGTVASSLTGIRVKDYHAIDTMYLYYWLNSEMEFIQRDLCINGSTAPNLSADDVKQFILFIPDIFEQKRIVDYLEKKCLALDSLIEKKNVFLLNLENYKRSLIYQCVTGKREVKK